MKIVIPSADEKLCGHFGHCEYFTFVEVNPESKEILNIEKKVPEEGISCQSANWIASQGANVVLAGGMGGRPMAIFAQNGVKIVAGCPELGIEEVVKQYLNDTLLTGENSCGGEHHHCHGHHHEHQHGKKSLTPIIKFVKVKAGRKFSSGFLIIAKSAILDKYKIVHINIE